MKTSSIVLLAFLGLAIGVLIFKYSDSGENASFKEALENSDPQNQLHIKGLLLKEMPIEYDPTKDANHFSFYLLDEAGDTSKVVSSEPKQQDFEMTDEVQMVGYMDEGFFRATKVMPKCPSKYEKENELASNNTGT